MTTEEIFKEVIKNPIFIEKYGLKKDEIEFESLNEKSNNPILEIIKSIIRNEGAKTEKKTTFKHIQSKIMGL